MRIKIDRARLRPQGMAAFARGHSDIALAIVLLAVLALLVLPAPSFVLDMAIALNFTFALMLLASSIYIRSALDISTFPSLLLLSTLFRLGLSVATTKMILLHGYAGDIVQTFGRIVVGGNIVVGLVIFCVLCAVQFIVVAKGGDRVAEVGARFTLDSIPGKQMSIDADLRAGAISNEQAKERREVLQNEIQMHGAMDGAMKFVKGDAIIGILIAVVNILGGITIGMIHRKMSVDEATQTYVVLTVGDGLVSQIPSLIVSIAAGLIITRGDGGGSGEGNENHLGRSVFDQLGMKFRPLLMAAIAAYLLACIPGFPSIQFVLIGSVLVVLAWGARRQASVDVGSKVVPMHNMTRDGSNYVAGMLDMVEMGTSAPLCVRLGEQACAVLDAARFDDELGNMRQYLMQSVGIPFPGLSIQAELQHASDSYSIDVNGIPVARGRLPDGQVFVVGNEGAAGADADEAVFVDGVGWGRWLQPEQAEPTDRDHLYTADRLLAQHLRYVCTMRAGALVGTQEVAFLLDRLSILFPDLVESLRSTLSVPAMAAVLRALLDEQVSIRNLKVIAEAIVNVGGQAKIPELAVRAARVALRKHIIGMLRDSSSGKLPVLLLHPEFERMMVRAIEILPSGESVFSLDAKAMTVVSHAVRRAQMTWGDNVVVLTGPLVRAHLADIIRHARWPVSVIAMDELDLEEAALDPQGVIELMSGQEEE